MRYFFYIVEDRRCKVKTVWCIYPDPLTFRIWTPIKGQTRRLKPLCVSIDRADLHAGVNINIPCIRMFLEHHGRLKHIRDGPRFLFNLTSSCFRDEWTWNLEEETRVSISDVVDVLLCCKWIFYVRTLGGFTSWATLFRNSHKLDVAGVEYLVELGLHLRKPF